MASADFVFSCYQDSEPPTLDTSALIFHAALHPRSFSRHVITQLAAFVLLMSLLRLSALIED